MHQIKKACPLKRKTVLASILSTFLQGRVFLKKAIHTAGDKDILFVETI